MVRRIVFYTISILLLADTVWCQADRIRCLYNGYLLTVDPVLALNPESKADRYRMYVLHAVLIDPEDGRIAAIYPALPGTPGNASYTALPVSDYQDLLSSETPPNPGISLDSVLSYWRNNGVSESLLSGLIAMDLQGSVVTAGLTDDHFHVSSYSKKLPEPGKMFGFFADIGDPIYYIDVSTWERMCRRKVLWNIIKDANQYLYEENLSGIYLHGYWYSDIDDPTEAGPAKTYLFNSGDTCETGSYNPVFIINRVGLSPVIPPADPCTSNQSGWPDMNYEIVPAILVHTSGQSCWYNSRLFELFNEAQIQRSALFSPIHAISVMPPSDPEDDQWTITLESGSAGLEVLLAQTLPCTIDAVAFSNNPLEKLHVPFAVVQIDAGNCLLTAKALFTDLAQTAFATPDNSIQIIPFYRIIDGCISDDEWEKATEYEGAEPTTSDLAYGYWDPNNPYGSNWYNGADRGLIQYFHDTDAGVWRPSGYAEHYVMRDMLASIARGESNVAQMMQERKLLAAWCHRHGITSVHDIMFYRRPDAQMDFDAYENLSYDHSYTSRADVKKSSITSELQPGDWFNLHVGLYYYLETAAEIGQILNLAANSSSGYDMDRLRPPAAHPEYPGWIEWLGWKIQLDGASGSYTFFSNAPLLKPRATDLYPTVDEESNAITFQDHSYGLLVMTNFQEQVFTSRETAALYWLVRESDPESIFYNPLMVGSWSFLQRGIVNFIDLTFNEAALKHDLSVLSHVEMIVSEDPPIDQPAELTAKVVTLFEQINDAYTQTMMALAKIWYEKSKKLSEGIELPSQVVSHCYEDGAVDLWIRCIKQLKNDIESFPANWNQLPDYWKEVIPETADLSVVKRAFDNERFRVEHIINYSCIAPLDIKGPQGIDADTDPSSRNIVFSTQPAILALDGQEFRDGFKYAQEIWPIPHCNDDDFWQGLPWRPRSNHIIPLPVYYEQDIPFTLNTDPPSVRDPRPCLTVLGAVARTPVEIDPSDWVGKTSERPLVKPPDYYAGKVYAPLGLTTQTPNNPMRISVEQALSAMTFWGGYAGKAEQSWGAIAEPGKGSTSPGWFADLVIWNYNPLGIHGPGGTTLDQLARMPEGIDDDERLATVNAFIEQFLPKMTLVRGLPVWQFGVRLDMPHSIRPGESFYVTGYLDNPGELRSRLPVLFMLDVYGEYWFWPSWSYYSPPESEQLDYRIMDIPTGTTPVEIIPEVEWPDTGSGIVTGLYMYGAILSQDWTQLEGSLAISEWSYGM